MATVPASMIPLLPTLETTEVAGLHAEDLQLRRLMATWRNEAKTFDQFNNNCQ